MLILLIPSMLAVYSEAFLTLLFFIDVSSLTGARADLINSQRSHGARQTLQAKTILKVLQMRDSLRAVRDRVVTAHAGASASAQSGSQSLYQSLFDPSFMLRAPAAVALIASQSKQVCTLAGCLDLTCLPCVRLFFGS